MIIKKKSGFAILCSRDRRLAKLKELTESGLFSKLDPNEVIKEVVRFHETKSIRSETTSKILEKFTNKSTDHILELQAARSRCVKLRIDVMRAQALLSEHIKTIEDHLATTYAVQLRSEYKTVSEKKVAIQNVLAPYTKMAARYQQALNIIREVVDDNDQSTWSVKSIIAVVTKQSLKEI